MTTVIDTFEPSHDCLAEAKRNPLLESVLSRIALLEVQCRNEINTREGGEPSTYAFGQLQQLCSVANDFKNIAIYRDEQQPPVVTAALDETRAIAPPSPIVMPVLLISASIRRAAQKLRNAA